MHVIYEFPKIANLASSELNVIPASLYIAEIVNAALTTLHHSDVVDDHHQPTIGPRRTRLTETVNEVSELLSTMNIYARHPVLDDMMGELGKNFLHFVKIFFSLIQCQHSPYRIS